MQHTYSEYKLDKNRYILFSILNLLFILLLSNFFYHSLIPTIGFLVLNHYLLKYEKKILCERRKYRLLLQFKDLLTSLSSSLKSGYSLENSVKLCLNDMSRLHGNNSDICRELETIVRSLTFNTTIEDAFMDFGVRSTMRPISDFCTVLSFAKKSGEHMVDIIQSSISTISLEIDLQRDIKSTTAAKVYERNIMAFMPIILVIYISITSSDLLTPLYSGVSGRVVMTLCLIIYLLALYITELQLRTLKKGFL